LTINGRATKSVGWYGIDNGRQASLRIEFRKTRAIKTGGGAVVLSRRWQGVGLWDFTERHWALCGADVRSLPISKFDRDWYRLRWRHLNRRSSAIPGWPCPMPKSARSEAPAQSGASPHFGHCVPGWRAHGRKPSGGAGRVGTDAGGQASRRRAPWPEELAWHSNRASCTFGKSA